MVKKSGYISAEKAENGPIKCSKEPVVEKFIGLK
jgi:hypothetical protein